MTLNVNRNLALETTPDFAPGVTLATDARAELAVQFIPAGSRVLDLSGATTLQRLLPSGCNYQSIVSDFNAGDFPTQAAAHSDIISHARRARTHRRRGEPVH